MAEKLVPIWDVSTPRKMTLTNQMCMLPYGVGTHVDGGLCNGGITVDGVPLCPVEPHPKCVAVGTCPGSC